MESPSRIEPTRLEPTEVISDLVAELLASTSLLEKALHPKTSSQLADLVRITNTYYSNLIEGHNTKPLEIELALRGKFDSNQERRNLQLEAKAHYRVQQEIDFTFREGSLPPAASTHYIQKLHRDFYHEAPIEMLEILNGHKKMLMLPGIWRSLPDHDVQVGRLIPPSSASVPQFMNYFEHAFAPERSSGVTAKILSIAIAHHRFNFIHPFLDGNGRVSRLMSHAMAHQAGIGANGLWSISRGLSRGLKSRGDYKNMMDLADTPRQGDLDGRGNLSQKALVEFTVWFLSICLDQVKFMSSLFDLGTLSGRLKRLVELHEELIPETNFLLQEALFRGEIHRGEVARITGLKERSASRLLSKVVQFGLLESTSPKGPVSLRFPAQTLDVLFPKLYSEL